MIKYIYCLAILFQISILAISAQTAENSNCDYGIKFEVSDNPSWGYGELVVTYVESYSQAEVMGIKLDDIIVEINGTSSYLKSNETIKSLLLDGKLNTTEFAIRNIGSYTRKVRLTRNCNPKSSLSEKELSKIFSFYSLENTSEREFTLPLQVVPNSLINYTNYQTYDFAPSDRVTDLDKEIITIIDRELRSKGMRRNTKSPDIVIQTYYNVRGNPQYNAELANAIDEIDKYTWRYNSNTQSMISIPVFDPENSGKYANANDIVNFGITLYDRKQVNTEALSQIWEGEIEDYIYQYGDYKLIDYLKVTIPLMLSQYPYATPKKQVRFNLKFSKYYYTGLQFNNHDFSRIESVDRGSPAYIAGIRAEDDIDSMDGKSFSPSNASLSDSYKLFITETSRYRDSETKYISQEGYTQTMYWNKEHQAEISQAFAEPKYLSIFSYLYKFEPYVSDDRANNRLAIEYWAGTTKQVVNITPVIRTSVEMESW